MKDYLLTVLEEVLWDLVFRAHFIIVRESLYHQISSIFSFNS